jgi:leader peptidase (prepilin peptidase)/N-methyltransferase
MGVLHDEWTRRVVATLLAGVYGLLIGSFLNVVIYRLPRSLSVVVPRSFCPQCRTLIRPLDNVPIVSWLALRRRCRACRTPIPGRYPLVEGVTGLLYGATTLVIGPNWWLPPTLAVLTGLLVLTVIELDGFLAPVSLVVLTLAAALALDIVAALATHAWWRLLDAAIGLAIGAASAVAIGAATGATTGEAPARPRSWSRWSVVPLGGLCLGWWGVPATDAGLLAMLLVLGVVAWPWRATTPDVPRSLVTPTTLIVATGCIVGVVVGSLLTTGTVPR